LHSRISKVGCEYYDDGLCGMTNIGELRKETGCKSEDKSICCRECSNSKVCLSRCKIRTYAPSLPRPMPPERTHAQVIPIRNLPVGIIGGIVAAIIGAFLLRLMTQFTGDFYFVFLAVCAAIGGFGFGIPTDGNKMLRGAMGCLFGIIAILLGYYLIYVMPINIGYASLSASEIMSFQAFLGKFLGPLDYLFILAGVVAAYFAGTGSLKLH